MAGQQRKRGPLEPVRGQQVAYLRESRPVHSTPPEDHEDLHELFSAKWQTVQKLRGVEQESGKRYRRGKFSNAERRIVNASVDEYVSEHGTSREAFLDALFNSVGRRRFADFFIKTTQKLSGRPVLMVYHYMKRLLHPGNRQGNWTAAEDMQLRRLFAVKGPQWVEISKEMGRFATSCRDRYRKIRADYIKGPWATDEVERLEAAVSELIHSREAAATLAETGELTDAPLTLSWYFVSERVRTRSWMQCISKWSHLSYRRTAATAPRWNANNDYQLCHQLYDLGIEDESEIIWRDLINDNPLWQQCYSPERLRNRWKMLRRRVLNEQRLDMDTVLETLLVTIRPLSADTVSDSDPES